MDKQEGCRVPAPAQYYCGMMLDDDTALAYHTRFCALSLFPPPRPTQGRDDLHQANTQPGQAAQRNAGYCTLVRSVASSLAARVLSLSPGSPPPLAPLPGGLTPPLPLPCLSARVWSRGGEDWASRRQFSHAQGQNKGSCINSSPLFFGFQSTASRVRPTGTVLEPRTRRREGRLAALAGSWC